MGQKQNKGGAEMNYIKTVWPGRCCVCGKTTERGDNIFYDAGGARGKKTYCATCGQKAGGVIADPAPAPAPQQAELMPATAPQQVELIPATAPAPAPANDLAAVIAGAVQSHLRLSAPIDADAVKAIVRAELAEKEPEIVRHEVKLPEMPAIDITGRHCQYVTLLTLIACRSHAWLVGPAGSGKTTAAEQAATDCGLPFYAVSVGEQTSIYQLSGHIAPDGKYIRSLFREAYERGGVFLLDEIDAGNANVLTCINSALANGVCAFPDGMIKRHADFVCLAAGNTYGRGANRVYVGRCQIDGATLDRFAFVDWRYDEALEKQIAGNDTWTEHVQKMRARADELGIRHIISPRASINGAKLLAAGMAQAEVETLVLWKGLDQDSIKKIKECA